MIIIIMGVTGSGKTTVGRLLAQDLGWPFYDGDDFHPEANIRKMANGKPLTDSDRAPWLAALARLIADLDQSGRSAVIACSGLKQSYREIVVANKPAARLVYLKANYDLIHERLSVRQDHFMKPDMIASQFEILEEPDNAAVVDAGKEIEEIVRRIRQLLIV